MDRVLEELLGRLKTLRTELKKYVPVQVARGDLRETAKAVSEKWFSDIAGPLTTEALIAEDVLKRYSDLFAQLLKLSAPSNAKSRYLEVVSALVKGFRDELILPLKQKSKTTASTSELDKVVAQLPDKHENEYIQEAIACAKHKLYKAAVVMGWCAAIDRMHRKIEQLGFAAFNVESARMASETKGRFKRFNKTFNVGSIGELREVFDSDVLWVLEGMQLLESNQHTRLKGCFDMRNQSAHPGEAPITEYNLLSFFSDINLIVLKNPKFELKQTTSEP